MLHFDLWVSCNFYEASIFYLQNTKERKFKQSKCNNKTYSLFSNKKPILLKKFQSKQNIRKKNPKDLKHFIFLHTMHLNRSKSKNCRRFQSNRLKRIWLEMKWPIPRCIHNTWHLRISNDASQIQTFYSIPMS